MASSFQLAQLTPSLTTLPNYNNPMLKTTNHFNIPLIISSKFDKKSINPSSLKEICKRGNLKEAFQSLSNYLCHQNVTHLSHDEAYSSVLELCAEKKALRQGQQIHTHVLKSNGYGNSVFLRTKVVFLYGKCGVVWDAEKVFDEIPQRTIFTWNAMLGAYVSNGEPWEALELYRVMRVNAVLVDACTFPCVIKACGLVKELRLGSEIHGFAIKSGCDCNGFVVNALVSMYAKFEDTFCARMLFDRIHDKDDVVLWNSIISAYSGSGDSMEALTLFREMQKGGVSMNSYTYVSALQACEEPFKKLGKEIHGAILKSSDHIHLYVANALLVMYTRCGRMREAAEVFRGMVEKDSVSWNSMLSGFVQNGFYGEALRFFHETLAAGQRADQVSVTSILGASGRLKNLLNGMEAHAYAVKKGLDADIQVANSLIDMYSKCCHIKYMEHVFKNMINKDVISWTTVIASYAQNDCHAKALDVFREVQAEGVQIDGMMIGSVLLACTSLRRLNHVKETHGFILRNGLSDLVLNNTLVDAYGQCNNIQLASRMFQLIKSKDVVSWTSMISAYVDNGLANEALSLFRSMKEDSLEPDSVTLVSILSASAILSSLKIGKEVHGFLIKRAFTLEGSVASSLVDMYARCGTLENSFRVFNSIKDNKDTVLWTCMIHASGMHGCGNEATELFNKMEMEDTHPDHVTFLVLLYACSHSGMIDKGKKYLEIMKQKYNLEPWPEHYACVVDLLGRANRLTEAYQFVKSMPIEPNAVVWCALLGACHVHSNKELGDIAARKLLNLEPGNPGNYVLVSNVFAATERWDDVDLVRGRMKQRGLKKNPACSWIEIRDKVHTFMARDKSHPQGDQIYDKLGEIIEKLKKGGYTAQTKYVLHNVDEEEKTKMLYGHSERLAISYALLESPNGVPIRVNKNLRICGDCHVFIKLVSKFFDRDIIVRDASRFHHFRQGSCSCGDFW